MTKVSGRYLAPWLLAHGQTPTPSLSTTDAIPIDAVVGDRRSAVRVGRAAHKPRPSRYFPTV